MGEVGLPGLVRLVGFEPDVAGLRSFGRIWRDGAGPDEILLQVSDTGALTRYHSDRHGNVTFLLDGGGNVIERYRYDAFGKPTIFSANNTQLSTSAYGNRFMFQGREWIGELGIYDYRHRYYQPALGRFLQSDPTGFDASDMNLFRYCGDDPVDRSDPMGLDYIDIEFTRMSTPLPLAATKCLATCIVEL